MILPDLNLLIYAVNTDASPHAVARQWWQHQLSASETVALTWTVLLGFVRLATNPRVFASPLDVTEAVGEIEAWLARPCTTLVHPSDRHPALLRELLSGTGTAGSLTTDAHLAALAIEHGATLCSADRDFARFPGLRWRNPLVQRG